MPEHRNIVILGLGGTRPRWLNEIHPSVRCTTCAPVTLDGRQIGSTSEAIWPDLGRPVGVFKAMVEVAGEHRLDPDRAVFRARLRQGSGLPGPPLHEVVLDPAPADFSPREVLLVRQQVALGFLDPRALRGVPEFRRTERPLGPVFDEAEFTDSARRPTPIEAWERLPVLVQVAGYDLRWLGPIEAMHPEWFENLASLAMSFLDEKYYWNSGWYGLLPEVPMWDDEARVRPVWTEAFGRAAERLITDARDAGVGFTSELWASWLALRRSELAAWLEAEAINRGCER